MNQRMLMNILWMAFFFGVVIFHALIVSNAVPPEGAPMASAALLGYILLFFGIFQLLIIVNLDIFLIGRPRKLRVGADILQGREAPEDPAQFAQAAKAAYILRMFIVFCALAEASGLCGLVLYLLGGPILLVHALFGLSYLSLMYIWLRFHYCWEAMYLE